MLQCIKVNNQQDIDCAIRYFESKGFNKCEESHIRTYCDLFPYVYMLDNYEFHYGNIFFGNYEDITNKYLKETYVKTDAIVALEEKALKFYTDRGYSKGNYINTKNTQDMIYVKYHNTGFANYSDNTDLIDITDIVLGKQEEVFNKPKQRIKQDEDLLINLPKKKMSTLRNNLRDRFFKKNESIIADKVESVEIIMSELSNITDYVDNLIANTGYLIKAIENAVDDNDKETLQEKLKKLNKQIKEFYEDKLTEQFITVGKKLIKD